MQTLKRDETLMVRHASYRKASATPIGLQWLQAPLFGALTSVSLIALSFPSLFAEILRKLFSITFAFDQLPTVASALGGASSRAMNIQNLPPQATLMSPFQTVIVAFAVGAISLLAVSFKEVTRSQVPNFSFLIRCFVSGLILLFGVFFFGGGGGEAHWAKNINFCKNIKF